MISYNKSNTCTTCWKMKPTRHSIIFFFLNLTKICNKNTIDLDVKILFFLWAYNITCYPTHMIHGSKFDFDMCIRLSDNESFNERLVELENIDERRLLVTYT